MNDVHWTEIGHRIAKIRKSKNMLQKDLADQTSLSVKFISRVECGTSTVSVSTLMKICDTLDCSLDYLVYGKSASSEHYLLPDGIESILLSGSDEDKSLLYKTLNLFLELRSIQYNK